MPTLTIDNFGGRLTRYNDGDINSGMAKFGTTFGNEPFSLPGKLTWYEQPIQIDPAGAVITDLIMAMKERVESGTSYVYAIGHTGRLYKIQVNNLGTTNPNYDTPTVLTTLVSNSPTFTRGGSIDFYGATERIYIGSDIGVTRVDFDGTNETFVGALGSWTQTVPRPLKQFLGVLYVGNGSNIAAIDSTASVTTYAKLSPSFPTNTQVKDIDVSPDGTYLQMVVGRLALPDITSTVQDTTFLSNSESYIFKWNGIDTGYTAYDYFPSFSLNSNITFGNEQYVFGYDIAGACVYSGARKIISLPFTQAPLPNGVTSNGNLVGWFSPEWNAGFMKAALYLFGSLDFEVTNGWWKNVLMSATGTETDVIRTPAQLLVSNFGIGPATNGYTAGVFSSGKLYFSTLETSATTTKYKLYKHYAVSTTAGTAVNGVYETQTQMFSKKAKISEVRIYAFPWVANNEFTVALIGSNGNPMTNGSKTFTAGSNLTVGDDFAWWNPDIAPTYQLAVRITNSGSANNIIDKIEIDYEEGGK